MKKNKNCQVVITRKTNQFNILTRPDIAPRGLQNAEIVEVCNLIGKKADKEFSQMDLVFRLNAKNRDGQNHVLTRSYNLSGRGVSLFLEDYNAMTGKEMTKTDLYDFDAQSLVKMPVQAEIDYIEGPKGIISKIKSFQPVNETSQPAVA